MVSNTSTQTETLTVNGAFLQEIKDSNVELWDTMHQIRCTCDQAQDPGAGAGSAQQRNEAAKQLIRLLGQLREHLSLQFALEESYGFIESVHEVDQRVSEGAEIARSQHYRLYLQLSDLHERGQQLQYSGFAGKQYQHLIDETHAFDLSLQQHERNEMLLIQLAQNSVYA